MCLGGKVVPATRAKAFSSSEVEAEPLRRLPSDDAGSISRSFDRSDRGSASSGFGSVISIVFVQGEVVNGASGAHWRKSMLDEFH